MGAHATDLLRKNPVKLIGNNELRDIYVAAPYWLVQGGHWPDFVLIQRCLPRLDAYPRD